MRISRVIFSKTNKKQKQLILWKPLSVAQVNSVSDDNIDLLLEVPSIIF